MNLHKPLIEDSSAADFSIGYAHAMLHDLDTLRTLIAEADEKMYQAKRSRSCAPAFG